MWIWNYTLNNQSAPASANNLSQIAQAFDSLLLSILLVMVSVCLYGLCAGITRHQNDVTIVSGAAMVMVLGLAYFTLTSTGLVL